MIIVLYEDSGPLYNDKKIHNYILIIRELYLLHCQKPYYEENDFLRVPMRVYMNVGVL